MPENRGRTPRGSGRLCRRWSILRVTLTWICLLFSLFSFLQQCWWNTGSNKPPKERLSHVLLLSWVRRRAALLMQFHCNNHSNLFFTNSGSREYLFHFVSPHISPWTFHTYSHAHKHTRIYTLWI